MASVMNNQCPSCQRLLYDRRLLRCGYCGAMIPEGMRFTEERIAEIDQEMAELERQRQERLRIAREEEEERARETVVVNLIT